ncbi:MAG: hypothetical protein U0Z44_21505 [Kouleothrix sp.]|nr:hypothetical protein [Kouleothrix sp.]
MPQLVQLTMMVVLFVAGLVLLGSGLWIILTREYQETLRALSAQSGRVSSKSLSDLAIQPALEGASQLMDAITRMVQTALGMGAFLCVLGALLCAASLWLSLQLG